ncbi:hypothetical protein V6N13_133407 [Hibiscus sabdariffa]
MIKGTIVDTFSSHHSFKQFVGLNQALPQWKEVEWDKYVVRTRRDYDAPGAPKWSIKGQGGFVAPGAPVRSIKGRVVYALGAPSGVTKGGLLTLPVPHKWV